MRPTTCLWIVCLIVAGLPAIFTACGESEPIKLGFVAGLTGRVADLGVGGRNGASLAVEEINQAGGINGRRIELIVRDDKQKPEAAQQAVRDLLSQKVEAIIGPMTSSMAMVMVPLVNNTKTVMVSPTVTTTNLVGRDDNFLRIISTTKDYATKNARYQVNELGRRSAAAIYDLSNRAYTQSWLDNFRTEFERLGGVILKVKSFSSGEDTVFFEATRDLLSVDPELVLIVANAVDAALITQQVRKLNDRVSIAMSEWASTERYIELAGAAAEGVHVAQFLDRNIKTTRYRKFNAAYQERFGQMPGFAGLAGYDATLVVLDALAIRKPGQSLKDTIIAKKIFQGVQQPITIDRYGDAKRKTFLTIVRNNQYITIK